MQPHQQTEANVLSQFADGQSARKCGRRAAEKNSAAGLSEAVDGLLRAVGVASDECWAGVEAGSTAYGRGSSSRACEDAGVQRWCVGRNESRNDIHRAVQV